MTISAEIERLILRIERAVVAREHLLVLVTVADETVARCRRELRNLKARGAQRSSRSIPE